MNIDVAVLTQVDNLQVSMSHITTTNASLESTDHFPLKTTGS